MKCQPDCTCKRHAAKGVKRDPAIGAKISAAKMGHEVSAEARAKISAAKRGQKQPPEHAAARVAKLRTHGMCGTPTYRSWKAMIQRCLNPKSDNYHLYGGRGITVCDRWRDFANFLADMGERPAGQSIDRIDNDRGYEPGNCKWSTRSEQNRNRPNFNPSKRGRRAA